MVVPALSAPDERADGYAGGMRVAIRPVALACCALEVATALHAPPPELDGIVWCDTEPDVTVVLVAGTVTTAARPKVAAALAEVAGPVVTVAYGVCASSGGPYWDSYAVQQGWAADVFVPGCPPRPEAVWSAVAEAVQVAHAAR